MRSIPILLFPILLLTSLTSSAPSLLPRQTPQQSYLRTSVVPSVATNDTGTPKGNLYILPYHTGAGLNDVVLTPNISYALSGSLGSATSFSSNDTTAWATNLTTPGANGSEIHWNMCTGSVPYANWAPMQINLGVTCNDFYADGDLLICSYGDWLVCDWWHGAPQLFYVTADQAIGWPTGFAFPVPFQAPSSCSVVDLQMIPVDGDDC